MKYNKPHIDDDDDAFPPFKRVEISSPYNDIYIFHKCPYDRL